MSKELVIFGRSPFVDTVDIPNLCQNYTTLGFNQFGRHHKVDYLFFFDAYYYGYKAGAAVYMPNWFEQKSGIKYIRKPSVKPIFGQQQDGMPVLGHKYFTVSLALNWALLQGFEKIYLVGIDHVETDTAFVHHDGDDCPSNLTPDAHGRLKDYVYACAEHAEIYQCNPAVADDWKLPYRDVKTLYS